MRKKDCPPTVLRCKCLVVFFAVIVNRPYLNINELIMKQIDYSIKLLALISLIVVLSGCFLQKAEPPGVIFIVPDGLSPGVWGTVRAVSAGYMNSTNLDRMPHTAVYSTYSANSWITDSAASMTAMMTGVKTDNGIIDQSADAVYKEGAGVQLESLMEYASKRGWATGIVSTTTVCHATPAACYADHYDRGQYEEIAAQLVDGEFTPDLILGGGRKYMRPKHYLDPEAGEFCTRSDGRDLVEELVSRGYEYFNSYSGFLEWNPAKQSKVLGLFEYKHMQYEFDRREDMLGEPPLWEMTEKALKALECAPQGFFLMVEAGRIDHAAHDNDDARLLYDCIAFDKTVGAAMKFLERRSNTLLLIAADHGCGGATGVGVKIKGDSIKVTGIPGPYRDDDGDGFPDNLDVENPLVLGWSSNPATLGFEPGSKSYYGSHTSEDCIAFAAGTGSEMVRGTMDNTDLYRIMKKVIDGEY